MFPLKDLARKGLRLWNDHQGVQATANTGTQFSMEIQLKTLFWIPLQCIPWVQSAVIIVYVPVSFPVWGWTSIRHVM